MPSVDERCTVAPRKVTLEDVEKMLKGQENISTPNQRSGDEDAFSKTLRGSKIYLEEQGLINESARV